MALFDFLSCIDLINLNHTSTFFRRNILDKLFKYCDCAEIFCIAKEWQRLLNNNIHNLLLELYGNALNDNYFCYEYLVLIFEEVKRHLTLFSIILHFLRCGRKCDGLCKKNCCFYYSRIEPRSFDSPSYFFDIITEQRDFTRDFYKLVQKTNIIDLDTHEDRPVVIDNPNSIKRQFDFLFFFFFHLYEYPRDLMNGSSLYQFDF